MWIKRVKTDRAEYDVLISEHPMYRKGIFVVKVCTAKKYWWMLRDTVKEFVTEDDPLLVARELIDKMEEEDHAYCERLKVLDSECKRHGQ